MSRLGIALAAALLGTACAHDPGGARIRYDLAVEAQRDGNIPGAVKELKLSIEKDPNFPEAHHMLGLLYHVSLGRPELAEPSYKKALELKPDFSEAANNLGALYLDQRRYAEAEAMFRKALDDVLYPTPHLARGNLGWCLYQQGRHREGITELKAAVITQPEFCQGYRNLGLIYRELGQGRESREAFARFKDKCPKVAEAWYEWGRTMLLGEEAEAARSAFERCLELAGATPRGEDCASSLDALGGPREPPLGAAGGETP